MTALLKWAVGSLATVAALGLAYGWVCSRDLNAGLTWAVER